MDTYYKTHDEVMREELSDPKVAAAYLNAAFEDGTPELILAALSTIKKVYGDKKFPVRLTAALPRTRRAAPKTRLLPATPKPSREAFERILAEVPDRPPMKGDEWPPKPKAARRAAPKPHRAAPKRTRKVAA
jgi:hypothetical protein